MELKLPPHIQKTTDGHHLSTLTSRYIDDSKIKDICDKYWSNNADNNPSELSKEFTTFSNTEQQNVVNNPIIIEVRKKRKARRVIPITPCAPAKYDEYLEQLSNEVYSDLNNESTDVVKKEGAPLIPEIPIQNDIDMIDDFIFRNSTFHRKDYYFMDSLIDLIIKDLKEYSIEWEIIYKEIVKTKPPKDYGLYYEEGMAAVVAAIYLNCPFADRIDFLSNIVNRTEDQIRALLGIHNVIYNFMNEEAEGCEKGHYNDLFWSLNLDCSKHFAFCYPIDYHYNYRNPHK